MKGHWLRKLASTVRVIGSPTPTPAPEYGDGVFGDGSGGAIVISVNTTITEDLHATTLTVNNSRHLTLGWNATEGRPARVYATTSITLGTSASINADGTAQLAGDSNGTIAGPSSLGTAPGAGGGVGGDSGQDVGEDSLPGTNTTNSIGGSGGIGGNQNDANANYTTGGGRGVATGGNILTSLTDIIAATSGGILVTGGAGGGAGGFYNSPGRRGFGGAGGGGICYVSAPQILTGASSSYPSISANGGAGAAGNATNGRAAGAPGGGGGVIVICNSIDENIILSAAPGAYSRGTGPTIVGPAFPGHIYLAANDPTVAVFSGYFHPVIVT